MDERTHNWNSYYAATVCSKIVGGIAFAYSFIFFLAGQPLMALATIPLGLYYTYVPTKLFETGKPLLSFLSFYIVFNIGVGVFSTAMGSELGIQLVYLPISILPIMILRERNLQKIKIICWMLPLTAISILSFYPSPGFEHFQVSDNLKQVIYDIDVISAFLITSILVLYLSGKIHQDETSSNRSFQQHTLPHYSISIFSLLGIIVIAGATSVTIFHVLRSKGEDSLKNLVEQRAISISKIIDNKITERLFALDRMATRFKKNSPEEYRFWKDDAKNFFDNFGAFKAIEWVDTSTKVQWLYPTKNNEAAIGLFLNSEKRRSDAIEFTRKHKKGALTQPVELIQGGRGFLSLHPTFDTSQNNEISGYIAGVYQISDLFSLIPIEGANFGYSILWNNEEVFSHSDQLQHDFSHTIALRVRNQEIEIRLSPTLYLVNNFVKSSHHFAISVLIFTAMLMLLIFILVQRHSKSTILKQKNEVELASKLRSRFFANMSHEIRTPLNGVLGMASLMEQELREFSDKEKASSTLKKLRIIENSGESLLTLLDDILDFSKFDEGKVELEIVPFNPRIAIEEVCAILQIRAESKGLQLNVKCENNIDTWVVSDPTRIRQVLTNLIGNAIKFTNMGHILVEWKLRRSGKNWTLQVGVEDSGIGLTQNEQEKLFNPFSQADASTTRRYGGTGLGLSICKSIADNMNGKISVSSTKGVGSKFTFEVPVKISNQSGEAQTESFAEIQKDIKKGLRVLIAEDNIVNATIVEGQLSALQVNFVTVNNGKEVLTKLKSESFDIILMDCHMPIMDGLSATREIVKTYGKQRPKIIALTASAMKEERDACHAAGMDDFLSKPLRKKRLISVLAKHS